MTEKPTPAKHYLNYQVPHSKLIVLYEQLLRSYKYSLGCHARASEHIDSLSQDLFLEKQMREKYEAEFLRLSNMHRTLPKGCFLTRQQQRRIELKEKRKLSTVDD